MNWLHYLLEANIYLGVFYVAYCLFLNKETHYLLNRLYLVLSSIVSFILPVLQLGILLPPLPEPSTASSFVAEQVTHVPAPIAVPVQVTAPSFTVQDGLWYVYLAGVTVCTVLLAIKLFSLYRLIHANKVTVQDNYKVVYLKDTNTAFSFFNYLFIGTAANNERTILRHELVHIRQKHSADILFLEFLKIVNWFNPLVYLLQHSLKTQHEYIADEQTVIDEADATSYSSFLVNNAYGISGPTITHSFYNLNLLKNRIIMLHQQRSGNLARLKYLVAVPIGAALLCASTLGFSKTYGWIDLAPHKAVKAIETYQEPPPNVIENAYVGLMNHVSKNIRYKSVDANKTGFVLVDFTITKDHKLADINVRQTVPPIRLREQVAGLFSSYKGTINDSPGKHILSVIFNAGGDRLKVGPNIQKTPGYAGEIVLNVPPAAPKPKIDVVKFPPPIVMPDVPADFKPEKSYVNEKGFKVEEGPFTANGKTYYVAIISNNETGKKVGTYYKGSYRASRESALYNKYGYKFPDVKVSPPLPEPPPEEPPRPKIDVVKFPPPVVRPAKSAPKPKIDQIKFPPPIVKPNPFNDAFLKFVADHVRYPTQAREKGTRGYVNVEIKIEDYIITNNRVIKGIGDGCDEEVLRVLNLYKDKTEVKSGTYLLAVAFDLANPDNEKAYPPLPKIDGVNTGRVVIVAYSIKK
jgi:hypothetical protein